MPGTIVLADISSSMAMEVAGRRRVDVLADILETVLQEQADTGGDDVRLWAFHAIAFPVWRSGEDVTAIRAALRPGADTRLAEAIETVAALAPDRLIVISDGEPNDGEAALRAATTLGRRGCLIETLFCGDEAAHAAVAFLRALAWCSGDGMGHTAIGDLRRAGEMTASLRLTFSS